ncbi:MAG: sigma 54-interacting transcriptional regulator [Sandaracinaceae bacterium]|nr:sigma 54-interacting transcriptional regulator [Sandaracinaceae bacterium]
MGLDTTTRRRGAIARPVRVGRPTLRVVYSGGICFDPPRSLDARPFAVGRAVGDGDLRLDDPVLSRTHATLGLAADGQGLLVRDSSSTGTELNGVRVSEAIARDGDVLRMGDSFFVFRADDPDDDAPIEGLVGVSPPTRRMRSSLALVGPTSATALLLGETGTGKEVAARALHAASGRAGAFVAVNCGAIPEPLAESQLFGHLAGAYTGARTSHDGYFRAADGGTLFLDEIGELLPSIQPKLLRALEERAVVPIGATRALDVDVRVVAATNRNLVEGVRAGTFRPDLYARLAEFVIELPPLRARREDILPIVVGALGAGIELSPELVATLLAYSWPFNVRELLKVVSSMTIRARGMTRFDEDMLDDRFRAADDAPERRPVTGDPRARPRRPARGRIAPSSSACCTTTAASSPRSLAPPVTRAGRSTAGCTSSGSIRTGIVATASERAVGRPSRESTRAVRSRIMPAMRAVSLLLVALALVPARARAQDGEAQYRALIEEAVVEFDAGRFPEARSLFLRAHDLAPNARTLRGVGMASFEMRDYVEAYRALSSSLDETVRP